MSVFPQFINFNHGYIAQFILLVVTYSILVIIIHLLYALLAKSACFGSLQGKVVEWLTNLAVVHLCTLELVLLRLVNKRTS